MSISESDHSEGQTLIEEQPTEPLTIQEKIDRKFVALGGFSVTQIIAVLALGIGGDTSALWITTNFGYFIQEPAYQCRIDGGDWTSGGICTVKNICDHDPHITDYRIDYSNPKTLDNWWQKLDL